MTKKVVMIVFFILIVCSFLVDGAVNYQTLFNDTSSSTILTFLGDSDRYGYVNMFGNAYVLGTSLNLEGMLSDWETVYLFNTTSPVDTDYITSNKWLVSDISTGLLLINPQDSSTYDSFAGTNMYDAEWISDEKWFYVDYTNNKVVLFNASSNSEISSYSGLTNPEGADYVSDTKFLVANTGADVVSLIDNGNAIRNYSTSIKNPTDVYYINDDEWLLTSKDGAFWSTGKVVHINSSSGAVIKQYTGFSSSVRSVDVLYQGNEEFWLVADASSGVFLINMTGGTDSFPNSMIYNYTQTNAAYDAKFISFNDWIISDKNGVKRVQQIKKYYPNDLTLNVGDDADDEWNYVGDFNTTATVSSFESEINDYLAGCSFTSSCDVPFKFHSDNSGRLNLSLLNISYDRIPSVVVMAPNGGESWAGVQIVQWNASDDDGDNLDMYVYYWSGGWNLINYTNNVPGVYTFNWDTSTVSDDQNYLIMINISDGIIGANDTSDAVFTVDNTLPTITISYPNGGELINGNINIQWTANDNFDTALDISIEYSTDNLTWILINSSTSGTNYIWDSSTIPDNNSIWIRVNATDNAGNENSDVSDGFLTIDNNAPTFSGVTPGDGYNETTSSTVVLNFTAGDSINNSLACDLYLDEVLTDSQDVISGTPSNFTITPGEGTFTWAIRCFDGINYGWSGNNTLTVDTKVLTPTFLPTGTIGSSSQTLTVANGETVTLNNASFNNNTISMTTVGLNLTYDATGLSTGTYELIVNLTDNFGHNDVFSHNYSVSIFSGSSGGGSGGSNNRQELPRGSDSGLVQCNDGIDNDGDGLIDLDDPECDDINDDSESKSTCVVVWECSDWGACIDGKQTRVCEDTNGCGVDYFKPEEVQDCISAAPEETFEVESSPAPGVGQAISLFDRLKANWGAILFATIVVAGLALFGWRKRIFGGKGFEPPFAKK